LGVLWFLLRIRGIISLRILLGWGGLRGVASAITMLLAPVLISWLSLSHGCVQQVFVISARLDESLVELCEIIFSLGVLSNQLDELWSNGEGGVIEFSDFLVIPDI